MRWAVRAECKGATYDTCKGSGQKTKRKETTCITVMEVGDNTEMDLKHDVSVSTGFSCSFIHLVLDGSEIHSCECDNTLSCY
jgi:hypothetical protein